MEGYKKMFEGLSDDLKEKATACKTAEELMELAKSEGIELTDEQLDTISGGVEWFCGDHNQDVGSHPHSV